MFQLVKVFIKIFSKQNNVFKVNIKSKNIYIQILFVFKYLQDANYIRNSAFYIFKTLATNIFNVSYPFSFRKRLKNIALAFKFDLHFRFKYFLDAKDYFIFKLYL